MSGEGLSEEFVPRAWVSTKETNLHDRIETIRLYENIPFSQILEHLKAIGKRKFLFIKARNPGKESNLGLGVGITPCLFSDGSLVQTLYDYGRVGKPNVFFEPRFSDEATYVAHLKEPFSKR